MNDQRNHRTSLVLLTVWTSFLLYGSIAAPIPGVNESHYLCKARHFWQSDWCSQDFFITSPNAHTVFYATIGCLTNIFSLEQSAWIGRGLAVLVLAWGWTSCFSQLFFTRWATLWCAWFFLAFNSCGSFSGEWLVGGVEGKVFSYGFLLAAFGDVLKGRKRMAAAWTGIAISFHPVVGMWGLFAFTASQFITGIKALRIARRAALSSDIAQVESGERIPSVTRRSRLSSLLPIDSVSIQACLIVLILALPGLIPVLQLLTESVPTETKYAATYLQVYYRLAHHLDPMRFPARAYLGYAVLLTVFASGFVWGGRTNSKRAFDQVVVMAVAFAAMGILIGYGPRPPKLMPYFAERMNLLKFYPFRLADVLLPIAVSVSLTSVLERTFLKSRISVSHHFPVPFSVAVMLLVFACSLFRAHSISETNRYSREDRKDWIDVCHWIKEHTPTDALVQSPTNGWAFKWFAQRAEYVAYKDCPQNAAGIVEWNRRLNFLQKWYEQKYSDHLYSADELRNLSRQTGLTHLLTDRLGPLELEPAYRNTTFQVYDLRELGD